MGTERLVQIQKRDLEIRFTSVKWLLVAGILICLTVFSDVLWAAAPSQAPLIVQGDRDFPPYEFINQKGKPDGFNIDLIKTIADLLEMDINIVLDDWENIPEALASGKAHLVTGMIRSADRERQFDFSIAHAGVFYCLFVRKTSSIKSIEDAREKAILVHAKAYSHEWLTKRKITNRIIPMPSPQEALRQLADGRYDCAVVERLSALTLLNKYKIENVVMVGPPLLCAPYAFAVKKGEDRLLAMLNEGLHLMHQGGIYDDLYRKWFSVADADARRMVLVRNGLLILAGVISLLIVVLIWMVSLKRLVRQRTADLMKSERRFQELGDLLPQTVFETDAGGRLSFLNHSGFEMLGVNPNQPLGEMNLFDFVSEIDGLDALLESDDQRGTNCRVRVSARGAFPALLYATPVMSAQHHIGWRGILVDITFQKELEKQVIEAQKMEAIGRLAGGVAHDFNNIVTGISAYAHSIRELPHDTVSVIDSADKILIGCDRASDLVRHFLVTAGRRQVEKQTVRLKAVVDEVFKLLQPTCGSSINLDNRMVDENDVVWAEPALVFQVLMNLCVNGVQAMADNGGALTVGLNDDSTLEDARSQEQRTFFVSDQGPGIDHEIIDRIFEPFFTTRRQKNGTGIGLFVVSQALSEMGGSIRVESDPGHGTSFIVSMPTMPRNHS